MIAACYILHYGKEWLYWSMRSVVDFVDWTHLFYTPVPSHGHTTSLVNPDTRDDLIDILPEFLAKGYDIRWHDAPQPYIYEGIHRDFAYKTCFDEGADIVLVVDVDEIWDPIVLQQSIQVVTSETNNYLFAIGMRHFWRSLKWVCDDAGMPLRFVKPHTAEQSAVRYLDTGKVFHMGYAQTPEIIQYKQDIHGHKGEWRQNWFEDKFLAWKPGDEDVHPTNEDNFWCPKPYIDDGTLEYLVGDHPYFKMEIIE